MRRPEIVLVVSASLRHSRGPIGISCRQTGWKRHEAPKTDKKCKTCCPNWSHFWTSNISRQTIFISQISISSQLHHKIIRR